MFGWRWGRASSFYFVRHEQNEMCLNVRWAFLFFNGIQRTDIRMNTVISILLVGLI
jgi:hypothetical protein